MEAAAAVAAAAANGLSSSEVDSSSDEEPSLKTKNRDPWLLLLELGTKGLYYLALSEREFQHP